MNLAEYLRLLRARWLLVAVIALACVIVAGLLAWTRTPLYAAGTQLFVSSASGDASQSYQSGLFLQQRVLSYAQIVSSPPVVEDVIRELKLRDSVRDLQAEISATVPTNTVLINVTVKDRSPQRARAIANAVGRRFSSFVAVLETPRGGTNSPVKVTITSPAQLPDHPVSPRKSLFLALGALLGLALGIGGAVLRETLDKRIRGAAHAAAIAVAPVLGQIADDPNANRRPLILVDDPSSARAEAYRRLRTNLSVLSANHGLRSFVVSSAVAAEGKTLIVANVGIAFAQAGYRVVLVDADLRRPKLAELLGVSSEVGLADVLAYGVPVEEALQAWRGDLPLEVLTAGGPPPNPSELLGSERLAAALDALTNRADIVILDAPALLPVSDSAILARVASGVILVTRVGSTSTDQLASAAASLRAVDQRALGVVLNRLSGRGAREHLGSDLAVAQAAARYQQPTGTNV